MPDDNAGTLIVGALLFALLVWLTWPACLWFGGGMAIYGIAGLVRKRLQSSHEAFGHGETAVHLATGVEAVLLNIALGLGLVAAVELVVNLCVWLGSDSHAWDGDVCTWLWNSEQRALWFRTTLTNVLHPRITLPLLIATSLVSAARPEWGLVKRVFGTRKYLCIGLQVLEVRYRLVPGVF